jgi:hypothetical protein
MSNTTHTEADTQCAEILNHLRSGKSITQRQASRGYGIDRLGARIYDLRRLGHPINREMVKVRARSGRATRVARYSLAD